MTYNTTLVGQPLPDLQYFSVDKVDPDTQKLSFRKTSLHQETGRNYVIITMPKAFTNTCTFDHLPGLMEEVIKINVLGFKVLCMAVNTVEEMHYWYKYRGIDATYILPVPDVKGELVKELGLDWESERLGTVAKRAAVIVRNGVLEKVMIDENPANVCESAGKVIITYLEENRA